MLNKITDDEIKSYRDIMITPGEATKKVLTVKTKEEEYISQKVESKFLDFVANFKKSVEGHLTNAFYATDIISSIVINKRLAELITITFEEWGYKVDTAMLVKENNISVLKIMIKWGSGEVK